jgi:hypothetical protein
MSAMPDAYLPRVGPKAQSAPCRANPRSPTPASSSPSRPNSCVKSTTTAGKTASPPAPKPSASWSKKASRRRNRPDHSGHPGACHESQSSTAMMMTTKLMRGPSPASAPASPACTRADTSPGRSPAAPLRDRRSTRPAQVEQKEARKEEPPAAASLPAPPPKPPAPARPQPAPPCAQPQPGPPAPSPAGQKPGRICAPPDQPTARRTSGTEIGSSPTSPR